jgi:hypothetical protein
MMEAARTTETSVDIQLRTWHYIPGDSELHSRRRENLISHKFRHVLLIVFFPQSKRQASIQPSLWLLRVLRKPRHVLLIVFYPQPKRQTSIQPFLWLLRVLRKPRHVLLIVFYPHPKRQTSIQPFLWLVLLRGLRNTITLQ